MLPQGQTLLVLLSQTHTASGPCWLCPSSSSSLPLSFPLTEAMHPLFVSLSVTNTNIPTKEMQPVLWVSWLVVVFKAICTLTLQLTQRATRSVQDKKEVETTAHSLSLSHLPRSEGCAWKLANTLSVRTLCAFHSEFTKKTQTHTHANIYLHLYCLQPNLIAVSEMKNRYLVSNVRPNGYATVLQHWDFSQNVIKKGEVFLWVTFPRLEYPDLT